MAYALSAGRCPRVSPQHDSAEDVEALRASLAARRKGGPEKKTMFHTMFSNFGGATGEPHTRVPPPRKATDEYFANIMKPKVANDNDSDSSDSEPDVRPQVMPSEHPLDDTGGSEVVEDRNPVVPKAEPAPPRPSAAPSAVKTVAPVKAPVVAKVGPLEPRPPSTPAPYPIPRPPMAVTAPAAPVVPPSNSRPAATVTPVSATVPTAATSARAAAPSPLPSPPPALPAQPVRLPPLPHDATGLPIEVLSSFIRQVKYGL